MHSMCQDFYSHSNCLITDKSAYCKEIFPKSADTPTRRAARFAGLMTGMMIDTLLSHDQVTPNAWGTESEITVGWP
ncbi:hypothetical protein RRG08_028534 [Elysia crispata]|uniref:Uncharacterized protein n=1 Tax=Elysia crispata TaxID=231223 RepID=A0AAE0Y9I1_9GAST|nr:hypothetical protein RRG08_028534 [Elysia crispata]